MTCERIIERLVDGARAADDPELGGHLGSCLRCYRAAADLRDLPHLTDLLRGAESDRQLQSGPGEAFWRSFPGKVAAARVSSGGQAAAAGVGQPPGTDRSGRPGRRLRTWLRRPMPAAFAGAACAAVVALVVIRPMREPTPGPSRVATISQRGAAAATPDDGLASVALDDLPVPRGQGLDESVRELDAAALGVMLDGLDRDLGWSATEDPNLTGAADLAGVSDLDELDYKGLETLRDALGRSI